jgi:hypothetical protein
MTNYVELSTEAKEALACWGFPSRLGGGGWAMRPKGDERGIILTTEGN